MSQQVLGAVKPHLMVTDPPYGVDYDPAWRKRAGVNLQQGQARQGRQRRPGRLARGLGAVPRRGRLRLACRPLRQHRAGLAGSRRLRGPRADHLGQGPLCAQPRPLSLAARALLVCGARHGALDRRPQAIDAVADPGPRGRRPRPRHAEAGRVHEAADREQLLARARRSTSRSAARAPPSSPPR